MPDSHPEVHLLSNRYELEKPLSSGGMAVVYRARDHMLDRTVAVKILREDFTRHEAFRERFRQEAKAAANLSHPNIVTVHDFGMDAGRLFIVMEYVPGTNLYAMLQTRGRFTVDEALPLIRQACAGIGYAHRAGLVHCDVKPHNILITPDNRVKVTDFGIARALASIQPEEKIEVVWGSPQYFSPEQAAGGAPSPASDVYSMGVVMYYMLTGRLPFTSSSSTELSQLHRLSPPPPPSQFNPAIPTPLEEIILKVLSKEPSARYRTADQLGRVLMTFTNQTEANPHLVSKAESSAQADQTQPSQQATGKNLLPSQPVPKPRFQLPSIRMVTSPASNPLDIDWLTLGLGLLALVAVGGLVPLWLWVYLAYNRPVP